MSMDILDVMEQTDWAILRKQKAFLLSVSVVSHEEQKLIDGTIYWFDAIQDAAVAQGIATEEQVFGESGEIS